MSIQTSECYNGYCLLHYLISLRTVLLLHRNTFYLNEGLRSTFTYVSVILYNICFMSEIILQFCIKREKKFRENEMDLISLLEKSLFNMTLHREMCPATESYQCCTGNVLSYHFTCT